MSGEYINKLDEVLSNGTLTLDWVVDDIVLKMDEESLKTIEAVESADGMARFHFFSGMAIRNGYGLWGDNALTQWFKRDLGVHHADDMSGIILEAVWYKVHGQAYDPATTVERFKEHWADLGINLDQTPMETGNKADE